MWRGHNRNPSDFTQPENTHSDSLSLELGFNELDHFSDEGLQAICAQRSLPTHGSREELLQRLRSYVTSPRVAQFDTFRGDDWPYVVGGNVSHCVSDTKLSEGTLYWDIAFPIIFMATDDTKLVSTEFTVGGKRWKAEFWPKGGEVDDTGTFVYSKMGLTLMGPSEPIKVFSYFYAKNSRGEWTLPRRCRKPDLYSTDRNRWVYMKWVRYSQLKEYEWQNKLMLRIEVRLYGDSETTHDDAINSGTIPAQNSTLIRNMQQLCNQPLFSDVILRVDGEEIQAHRALLATQSPVFKAMFEHEMKESTDGIVDIVDTNPEIFKLFLEYCYTSVLPVMQDKDVGQLVILADKYQVESLTVQCLRYLCSTLTQENVVDVFLLADKYRWIEITADLRYRAVAYICRNLSSVMQENSWKNLNEEHLNEILTRFASEQTRNAETSNKEDMSSTSSVTGIEPMI